MKKTLIKTVTVVAFLVCAAPVFGTPSSNFQATNATHSSICKFDSQKIISLQKESELINSVQSHPNYVGMLDEYPNDEKRLALINAEEDEYILFQITGMDDNHYYVGHEKGIRHFSIHSTSKSVALIHNGNNRNYPNLSTTIHCTLG